MKCYVKENQDFHLELIYLDNHLLVAIKPEGIATQPEFHEAAKAYLKNQTGKEGAVFLHPIHRLDKPVSGLVLFARSSKALSRLNELLRERKIEKTYLAKVEGSFKEKEGILEHYLFHDDFHAKVASAPFPEAKKALLSYRVLKRNGKYSLLEITLHTGRYHQIRAQLSFVGHPIAGDTKYGAKPIEQGIALSHVRMQFVHPVTKAELDFHYDNLIPWM